MKSSDVFKKFVAHQKQFFKDLKEQQRLHTEWDNLNDLYQRVHADSSPIFVLSTGRVGTKLLTELVDIDEATYAVHEPLPELTYHSMEAYKNPKASEIKTGVDVARYELIRNAFLLGKTYVETNNRITFFAYALAELYPKARFIHLIRNPHSFVNSGTQRGWYSGNNLYDEGRITMDDKEKWSNLSMEKKTAWLWAATNEFVETFKESHKKRTYTLKAEDLYAGNKACEDALAFMGVNISTKEILKMVGTKVNASKRGLNKKVILTPNLLNRFEALKEYYDY